MLLLSEQNQVMTRTIARVESLWECDVNRHLRSTIADGHHAHQRTRHGNVLEESPTVFSPKHRGPVED
jgi:hypothetical protein